MGCSGTSNSGYNLKNNEFYREAMGFRKNQRKGLHVDEDFTSTATLRKLRISEGLDFGEELIDHGDESACVKPWLSNILPPMHGIEEDLSIPKYNLEIEHVFGFRIEDTRQDLFYLGRDDLVYISSSLAIIQNIDDYSQILFGGFASKEERECHDNHITSLDFYKGNVSFCATGQRGIKPKILVWSPIDTSVIFAKFQQPKGSKEVSRLAFDRFGHYLASFGKDEKNSFYIFDLRTKEMFWEYATGSNDFLLDLKFNPLKDEICLVGVNKIIFAFPNMKHVNNLYDSSNGTKIFTAVTYTAKGKCLIGNDKGEIRVYEGEKKKHTLSVGNGSIQNLTISNQFHKIYVSTSENYVYIFKDSDDYDKLDKFQMNSIVKSLDVNEDEDIVMGLKNGDIIIKHYKDKNKIEEVFLKTHSMGEIGGIVFVPDSRAVSSGGDNQILVWNLRSKKCENYSLINEVRPVYENDNFGKFTFPPSNRSSCISYNKSKGHVAIGIDDGSISIRLGIKNLNEKVVPDFSVGKSKVIELKYTNYGDLLLSSCESGELALMDCNNNYKIIKNNKIKTPIYRFDWDVSCNYIQAETTDANYIFVEVKNLNLVENLNDVINYDWNDINVKFCFTVQGVFVGSTDPEFISCVSKANNKKILCSGNDTFMINLFNYPVIDDNSKFKGYKGHSGKVNRVIWRDDDERILSIAKDDQAIIYWKIIREEAK